MPIDPVMFTELLSSATTVRTDLLKWQDEYASFLGQPVEVDSTDPLSLYSKVLQFENPWLGSMKCGYWTCMLICQESLNQVNPKEEYTKTNKEYARNIYRSLETVGAGIMGGYRIGFAVRVAYDFADIATQSYIRALLERMKAMYGSVDPSGYPPVAPNDYMYN